MADRRRKKRPPRVPAAAKKRIDALAARVAELEGVLAQHGKLGPPPVDDALAGVEWIVRGLLEVAEEVRTDPDLSKAQRRTEFLKVADRVAKLRDDVEINAALDKLRAGDQQLQQRKPGPPMTDAPSLQTAAGPIAPRRGRPPRSAVR